MLRWWVRTRTLVWIGGRGSSRNRGFDRGGQGRDAVEDAGEESDGSLVGRAVAERGLADELVAARGEETIAAPGEQGRDALEGRRVGGLQGQAPEGAAAGRA